MTLQPKKLLFSEKAHEKLGQGVDHIADVVSITLGPKGKNVGLDTSWGAPKITNDGNSIVKEIEAKDPFVNMGVSFGKELAEKMKQSAGDGTTTAILLLRAITKEGLKNIASGANPIHLKRGIEKACQALLKRLDEIATPIQNHEEIKNIATISSSGDSSIGELISQAIEKVGKSGVITIEEGKTTETKIDFVEGMELDRGYLSSYFCTHPETLSVEMENPHVLVTDKKISSIQEILSLLEPLAASSQPLLIIADDVEGEALSTLVINKLRGHLQVAAIKAPQFGEQRKALLEDIAILTGATYISEDKGMVLREAETNCLGKVDKVLITKDTTTLIRGQGDRKSIQERVEQLQAQAKEAKSSFDREKLEERKAKLQTGVAIIRVGGTTDPEMKQKKQLFEDSLSSTQAAIKEGIVPGGGVALIRAREILSTLSISREENLGAQILYKACSVPLKQLIFNTGEDPSLFIEEVINSPKEIGFNALTGKVENLIQAGVIDAAKVVKDSLRYAVSIASVILLSEVLIENDKES